MSVTTAGRRTASGPVVPAALAAVAEAGALFLPVRLVAVEATGAGAGPLVDLPWFALLFVGGVAAATAGGGGRLVAAAAGVVGAAAGLLQGAVWGSGHAAAAATAVLAGLVVALRVVTLGARDWRDPIDTSLAWGIGALFVEILMATSVSGWTELLPFVVPTFFLASLASRAASVRLGGVAIGGAQGLRAWVRLWVPVVAALAAVLVVAVLAGQPGGALEALGRLIYPVLSAVLWVLTFVIAQLARPLVWLAERIGVDVSRLDDLDLLAPTRPPSGTAAPPGSVGWLQRVLGLLAFLGALFVVIRALGRQRPPPPRVAPAVEGSPDVEIRAAPRSAARILPRLPRLRRREMPCETVRRWYADVLLALEAKNLPKPAAVTPDEFAVVVASAYPAAEPTFRSLTRAYDDVRYGAALLMPPRLERLAEEHRRLMLVLRGEPPLAAETEEGR